MILKIGSIYSLMYTNWKTNFKIYAFIMWPGGGVTKTHLLNLGAVQLSILDRAKMVRVIVQLSKVPNSSKYNGRLLYTIFKRYMPREMSKCYRTFHTNLIVQASLINYGLNKEEDFTDIELSGQSRELYMKAQRDFQVKAINWYSKRGYNMDAIKNKMASTTDVTGKTAAGQTKGAMPGVMKPATKPATHSAIKETHEEEIKKTTTPVQPPTTTPTNDGGDNTPPSTDGGSEFGY